MERTKIVVKGERSLDVPRWGWVSSTMLNQVGSATCPFSGTHGDGTMFNEIHLPIPTQLQRNSKQRGIYFFFSKFYLTKLSHHILACLSYECPHPKAFYEVLTMEHHLK